MKSYEQFFTELENLLNSVGFNKLTLSMKRDKKAIDGLTFVLDGPSGVEVVAGIETSIVKEILNHMDQN